jgi:hypothetical protein
MKLSDSPVIVARSSEARCAKERKAALHCEALHAFAVEVPDAAASQRLLYRH